MLERVLEPEAMDTPDEARDYDAMDHGDVNRAFAADFLAGWDGGGPVLDVGTGTAQIPIELCRLYAEMDAAADDGVRGRWGDIRITAVDLADPMLAVARGNVEAAGFADRVTVEKADAKQLHFPDWHFGAVVSNSIVHHIPDPFACLSEMHRVCRLEGVVFVRDLLRPDDEATLQQLVENHAAGCNDRQRSLFAASLRAALTLDEVRELVGRLGDPPHAVQQTSDRHWTWATIRGDSPG